jgi:hypothetical protein
MDCGERLFLAAGPIRVGSCRLERSWPMTIYYLKLKWILIPDFFTQVFNPAILKFFPEKALPS